MSADRLRWPDAVEPAQGRTVQESLLFLAVLPVVFGLAWGAGLTVEALGLGGSGGPLLRGAVSLSVGGALALACHRAGWLGGSHRVRRQAGGAPDGERRSAWGRRIDRRWTASVTMTLLGIAFVLAEHHAPAVGATAAGVAVAGLTGVLLHFWRGGIEVRWDAATLVPGRRAVFHVATTEGSSRLLRARYLLRCVARDAGDAATLGGEVPPLVSIVADCEAVGEGGTPPGPGEFVRVEFDVPSDAPPTASSAALSTRWELLIHGRSTWGALTEVFDVPFAAAPAAASRTETPAAV